MNIATLIHGLGSIGIFSSRAFLPALVTALLLRFGPEIPLIASTGLVDQIQGEPNWFTHDVTLLVLGFLSAMEIAATKNPEAREALRDAHKYLKTGMSVLTYIGVLGAADIGFVEGIVRRAGFGEYAFAAALGAGTFLLSDARGAIAADAAAADEGDELGVQGLASWAEDLWSVAGLVLLVLYPVAMLIVIGIIAGMILLLRRRAERREAKSKVPCSNCGTPIYSSAMACPRCGTAVEAPRAVGWLGRSTEEPSRDLDLHPYRLVEKKRCPVCATRFERRGLPQTCPACGYELMADPAFQREYIHYIDRRVPGVCIVGFLLGLVPILGLIAGVVYYRLVLIAPFRRYIPLGRGFLLRWGVRLVLLALIFMQLVPLVGGLAVPLMALISYGAYRSTFLSISEGQERRHGPDDSSRGTQRLQRRDENQD